MKGAETGPISVLVTGASGRIGRLLRPVWGDNPPELGPILWVTRHGGAAPYHAWDIGETSPPVLPRGGVVLHLAGRISGTAAELAENRAVTEVVCRAARDAGARHVFVMSSAAVYAPGPGDLGEGAVPGPLAAYGAAKLAAEQVAAEVLRGSATGLTVLRLANLAGADALLGNAVPGRMVVLDPIAGQPGGPVRSYIGPRTLARVVADLLRLRVGLPDVVNVAQQPPVAMADLLKARGQLWQFGPPRDGAVARVVLETRLLAGLTDLPQTSPAALVDEWNSLPGWPQ